MLSRIKKNDTVFVLAGKDKRKQSVVLSVDPVKELALVKDVAIAIHHVKPTRAGEKGKIVHEEKSVPLAKLMPVCPLSKKPCRVKVVYTNDGQDKSRACHCCNQPF